MKDSKWFGEPHTLTVTSVTPPMGEFDAGHLEYEVEHPPSCEQKTRDYGGVTVLEYACGVAYEETEGDLAFSLRYSGTPITEPGTYTIQDWGTKTYYYWTGYEHDTGVAVISTEGGEAA
jgi:hypothetical protein